SLYVATSHILTYGADCYRNTLNFGTAITIVKSAWTDLKLPPPSSAGSPDGMSTDITYADPSLIIVTIVDTGSLNTPLIPIPTIASMIRSACVISSAAT